MNATEVQNQRILSEAVMKIRLQEIVDAIRDLKRMDQEEWREKYPILFLMARHGPVNPEMSDRPVTRFFENLQVELQLRTAELLCLQVTAVLNRS